MDHYKVLGVHRNASKDDIKKAFRRLAMEFHPDKHADSPKYMKDSATTKFKQLSEAYEILSDDHKRADYNIGRRSSNYHNNSSSRGAGGGGGGGYGYGNSRGYGYSYGYGYSGAGTGDRGRSTGMPLKFEVFLRFLTTRAFLLNVAFAG